MGPARRFPIAAILTRGEMPSTDSRLAVRNDLGLMIAVRHERISHVMFTLRTIDEDKRKEYGDMLRARWGSPTVDLKESRSWTWTPPGLEITAQVWELSTLVELSPRP